MAKKFTFADAKLKIKELEDQLQDKVKEVAELVDDIALDTDDNIYDTREQKVIKVFKYGFWILLALNIYQFFA